MLELVLQDGTFSHLPIERDPRVVEPDQWLSTPTLSLRQPWDLYVGHRTRTPKQQLISWVQENPAKADYGFRDELIELGTRVVEDWGGYDNIVEG